MLEFTRGMGKKTNAGVCVVSQSPVAFKGNAPPIEWSLNSQENSFGGGKVAPLSV